MPIKQKIGLQSEKITLKFHPSAGNHYDTPEGRKLIESLALRAESICS